MQQCMMGLLTPATALHGWTLLNKVYIPQAVEAQAVSLMRGGHLLMQKRFETLAGVQGVFTYLVQETEVILRHG